MPTRSSPTPADRQPRADRPTRRTATHQAREVAESFGAYPERYDRTRPRYPAAMVDRIVAASPGPDVLDVGCGTGIAARQFQAAGCRVLGVEPDARMADWARGRGVDVEVAKFEDWDPGGRSFDTVIAAMAWHWIDPIAGARQAARSLRDGGRIAVFWNVFEPTPELSEAFAGVYRSVVPDSPFSGRPLPGLGQYSTVLDRAADGLRAVGAFSEPERWLFEWRQTYTREEWLDLVPTFGGHGLFPSARLNALLAGLGDVIDAAGGSLEMRYTAAVQTAVRTAARVG